MYVIVMIMVLAGNHKIASDQIIYPSMEMCESSRAILLQNLESTKPTKDSVIFSKCTMLSFEEHRSKVSL